MLPLQQAFEVKESILEFIRTTYELKDSDVHKAFYAFIRDPKHGLIKGPYISFKAPFLGAEERGGDSSGNQVGVPSVQTSDRGLQET